MSCLFELSSFFSPMAHHEPAQWNTPAMSSTCVLKKWKVGDERVGSCWEACGGENLWKAHGNMWVKEVVHLFEGVVIGPKRNGKNRGWWCHVCVGGVRHRHQQ